MDIIDVIIWEYIVGLFMILRGDKPMMAVVEGISCYFFYFEYNMEMIQMMRRFRSARWNMADKVWVVDKPYADEGLIPSASTKSSGYRASCPIEFLMGAKLRST